ncbi:peroxiredoxin family protein [Paludibaculum fermentans]|uniref:TlpA family protein disulfide reductase n=1 Tax=Paludibaculum fermentans TaxID=1473598 RepID=A0A7S7NTB0_PALFE|nr:TlpA disulfide reductase family protein [Paludibaculum fermentans]QOY89329.1 TlpA family protein disulfide reductase [Paludibaculum fermentans]
MINRRNFVGLGAAASLGGLNLFADLQVPKPAPELVITLNSGELVLLSKLKGKVVVLEFLLTTCPHCQRCSAVMQKVLNDMGGEKAFTALGAAVNPDDLTQARMVIPEYIYKLGLKFPVGYTKREMAYQWLGADPNKGPVYFPQLVFIDRKGMIRAYHPGTDTKFFEDEENNVRKVVEGLVKEGTGAALRSQAKKG